ncbi:MAG: diphthine--ammonia ligase [Thermoplasmatota archaeon]
MRLGALYSGGKDSTLAVEMAAREGHEVAALITIASDNPESYMFHVPNVWLTRLQAEAMGFPLVQRRTEGVKERELEDLKAAVAEAVAEHGVEGLVSGAIQSGYQMSRVEALCREMGLESVAPLWRRDPAELLGHLATGGYRVVMVAVAAEGLGPEWLGRELDEAAVEELIGLHERYQVSVAGEGGEFETLVLDAPIFRKRLMILEAERVWSGRSGVYRIVRAALADK